MLREWNQTAEFGVTDLAPEHRLPWRYVIADAFLVGDHTLRQGVLVALATDTHTFDWQLLVVVVARHGSVGHGASGRRTAMDKHTLALGHL